MTTNVLVRGRTTEVRAVPQEKNRNEVLDPSRTRELSMRSTGPLDRIVVGVDFSEVSLAAAQWVGRHLARDSTLTLIHVIEPPPLPNVLQRRSAGMPDCQRRLQARIVSLRGALQGLSRVVGGTGTGVEVRVGDPALQLAAYAEMADADLVVVGGNAVSRAGPRHETATTDRLLRRLACPVLVSRNAEALPTTVLAALADDVAGPVLTVAQMVAAPCAARVVTLSLTDRTSDGAFASVEHPLGLTSTLIETRDAAPKLEQVRMMIVDVARKLRADVVVIGSCVPATDADDDTAHMLVRTANCSVLVVPPSAKQPSRRPLHSDVIGRHAYDATSIESLEET